MELFQAETLSPLTPAELLAREEALLEHCEETDHPGFLSFWESTTYFVVLGYSKHFQQEVFAEECSHRKIPILRRCSGGGTVLQGPNCLNYTIVLPISSAPELETITGANRHIMERIRASLRAVAPGEIRIQGNTDLTLNGLKFSGNAQRRKRRALLFHGSFLLNFDLNLISRTLRLPIQQPDYRQNRAHDTFLINLSVEPSRIMTALIDTWNAKQNSSSELRQLIMAKTEHLVSTKYSRDDWNLRS